MPSSDQPRPYEPLTARYGSVGESGEWREAIEAYYRDELEPAWAIAQRLGAGFGGAALRWYRMIEGEALTRERAEVVEINPWLSFEGAVELDDERRDAMVASCERVGKGLEWGFEMPARITAMLPDVDAPWHEARYGYCVDKYPYDKVCVPHAAYHDPELLARVVAHEYTHVVTLNLTQNRIPHWLDEGLAMLMEGAPPHPVDRWLSPTEMEAAFEADRREAVGLSRSGHAYSQAAGLVRHLRALGGDAKLARILRAFTNNSAWTEIRINLLGEPSVEEALHEVYGMGQAELFEAAR